MYGAPPPPPYGNQYPPYYPPPQYYPQPYPKRHSYGFARSCCRCICCCCCFLLILILIQLFSILYFYHVYDPRAPTYTVENIDVRSFSMKSDSTVKSDLHVAIRAENPNKNIGFIYGRDSFITLDYADVTVSSGKLPEFQQGHRNTTILEVDLTGKSTVTPELQQEFMENKKDHMIPLMVRMKVPIQIVLGDAPLREFKVFVNCSLVLDTLSANKTSRIISRDTVYAVEF